MDTIVKKDKKAIFLAPLKKGNRIWGDKSEAAEQQINNLEFPSSKVEDWKYTKVNKLINGQFSFNNVHKINNIDSYILSNDYYLLVFVNGYYQESLSTLKQGEQDGWSFYNSGSCGNNEEFNGLIGNKLRQENDIFTVLNTAFSQDGYVLKFEKGKILDQPIHVVNIIDGSNIASIARNLVIVGENSEVKIIETYHNTNGSSGFANGITEFEVKKNSKLFVDKLQHEQAGVFHLDTTQVNQERDSVASIATFTLNGDWVRNNLNFLQNGVNCESNLTGLYFLEGKQHVDNHTYVYHGKENSLSNELYKGIMAGKSTGVFNGKVFVERDAQKTNAYQSNANVLLSDDATINSKPELEIYADDVKCSHGSTVGQLDEEAMFYLQSRGIGKDTSKKILVRAFAEDALDLVKNDLLRDKILTILDDKFEQLSL